MRMNSLLSTIITRNKLMISTGINKKKTFYQKQSAQQMFSGRIRMLVSSTLSYSILQYNGLNGRRVTTMLITYSKMWL
jgi:hypothetical protein